jgi:hypothetical protein
MYMLYIIANLKFYTTFTRLTLLELSQNTIRKHRLVHNNIANFYAYHHLVLLTSDSTGILLCLIHDI